MIRKLILVSTVLCFTLFGIQARGRDDTPVFGVRLAMDVNFPTGKNNMYNTSAGFSVGGVARWNLPENFFIEPGINFTYSAMSAKDLSSFDDDYFYQGAAKFYGLRIPVNLGYALNINRQTELAFFTGPYIHLNFSARQSLLPNMSAPDRLPDKNINLFNNGWKKIDAGWGLGLSLTFARCYYVGLSGGVSFTPLAVYGNKDKKIRIHRNMVAVTLGYNF